MRTWLVPLAILIMFVPSFAAQAAELTDVIDAADGDDIIDINIDINFRSSLSRAKITHEWQQAWTQPGQSLRPDYNELRFNEQIYAMDYMIEIGLFHDLELYVNLPWIIKDRKQINFVAGVTSDGSGGTSRSTVWSDAAGFTNATAENPGTKPTSERAGIGDMQIGIKWAPFNEERDDTKSVWVVGLDFTIPSGQLANPDQVSGGEEGGVGLGHFVLTPQLLFSHRYSVIDPYVGIQGSIPIQAGPAKDAGFKIPYYGGFLTGLEIIPWERNDKHQKFSIDIRLWTTFFSEVESKGHPDAQGTVNEMSDFLIASGANPNNVSRQLQATSQYTQFGLLLGFAFRAAEFVKLRFGVSLAHNTEHFVTGADFCDDNNGDGNCDQADGDLINVYRNGTYDDPGQRLRIEETTLFTWWLTALATF